MASTKISALPAYTVAIDDDLLCIVDVTTSVTKRIKLSDLVSSIDTFTVFKYLNKTGAQTFSLPADSRIDRITFFKYSGTPSIKVGTTAGASDLSGGTIPVTGIYELLPDLTTYYSVGASTIYITITGGNVDYRFDLTLNLK